jgi:hypothetical protein
MVESIITFAAGLRCHVLEDQFPDAALGPPAEARMHDLEATEALEKIAPGSCENVLYLLHPRLPPDCNHKVVRRRLPHIL